MNGLWIKLAVVGTVLLVWGLWKFARTFKPDAELGGIPPSPMEKLARVGALISGIVGLGLGGLIAVEGVTAFDSSPEVRAIFALLILTGVGAWFGAWFLTNRRRGGLVLDERDRSILSRSLAVESAVVLLSVLVWTVTLTEAFWNEKTVPLEYIQLLFWSTFILAVLGRSLGIILGYHTSGLDA